MLFFSVQQELDCISDSGHILGKIKFDGANSSHIFCPTDDTVVLSTEQEAKIAERLVGLNLGKFSIAMHDDD